MDAKIQISIDVIDLGEALDLARASVKAGVDWLEVGTPLLLAEGLHAVRAFRSAFPDTPIVVDLKTMDGAGLEAEMMFKAQGLARERLLDAVEPVRDPAGVEFRDHDLQPRV
ncbi:MAG: orotidine 5'-phosphate decarboxylase, partial [Chloroflexi bacterium]|nr:orotidine 5'-phosphate decarboxylase [Chloroflexota bacterium]